MKYPQNYPTNSAIWKRFYELTQVPRPSKKEEKVIQYLIDVARKNNLEYKQDSVKNVIIYLPASKGYENHPTVIIQNHMDMVCDKTPNKTFNFETDPIQVRVENGWVCATDTTLGGDNGIGCAAALALIDEQTPHPPLELLFTVDEETGLHGALNLDASLLKGRKLLNLDTEEWGSAYIGCAGGIDYELTRSCQSTGPTAGFVTAGLAIRSLKGGHSGIDIHRGRANSIKVLSDILWSARSFNYELAEFKGGKAHNIIPRDATATICLAKNDWVLLRDLVAKKTEEYRGYFVKEDMEFEISLEESTKLPEKVFTKAEQERILNLLTLFPHGPASFNWQGSEPIVNYSNNLAIVKCAEDKIYINTSLRFFDRNQVRDLEHQVESLAQCFQLDLHPRSEYPSWKPDFNNSLIDVAKKVYKRDHSKELGIKAIHAGLECGILKSKIGNIEALSFGPNLKGAHSPTEALEIDSTNKFWEFFKAVLREL